MSKPDDVAPLEILLLGFLLGCLPVRQDLELFEDRIPIYLISFKSLARVGPPSR